MSTAGTSKLGETEWPGLGNAADAGAPGTRKQRPQQSSHLRSRPTPDESDLQWALLPLLHLLRIYRHQIG